MRLLSILLLISLIACVVPERENARSSEPNIDGTTPSESELSHHEGPQVLVRTAAGAPADGARVWLVDPLARSPEAFVLASRTTGDWVATSRAMAIEVAVTGRDGLVTFARTPEAGYLIAAERGAGFAAAERTRGISDPLELTLTERTAYPVFVETADGSPAARVPVSLAVDTGADLRTLPSTTTTDASGRATLYEPPSAVFLADPDLAAAVANLPRMVVARIPARHRARARTNPNGATRLTLPPTSSLTLRAAPWAGYAQVFAATEGSRSTATLAVPIEDGTVQLPHVETGVDLRVVALVAEASASHRYLGSVREAIVGRSDGAALVHDLELDRARIVTGRCVDEHGEPLGRRPVDLFVVGEPRTSWTVMTDEDGSFRWLVAGLERDPATARIAARIAPVGPAVGSEPGRRGSIALSADGAPIEPGATVDVGDLVLTTM